MTAGPDSASLTRMAFSGARGFLSGGMVIWELDGNQFEFTPSEFEDLSRDLREEGLFEGLKTTRPALLAQILTLGRPETEEEEKELEYILEQSFLDLQQKLDMLRD